MRTLTTAMLKIKTYLILNIMLTVKLFFLQFSRQSYSSPAYVTFLLSSSRTSTLQMNISRTLKYSTKQARWIQTLFSAHLFTVYLKILRLLKLSSLTFFPGITLFTRIPELLQQTAHFPRLIGTQQVSTRLNSKNFPNSLTHSSQLFFLL